jgi:hypothetical protein
MNFCLFFDICYMICMKFGVSDLHMVLKGICVVCESQYRV